MYYAGQTMRSTVRIPGNRLNSEILENISFELMYYNFYKDDSLIPTLEQRSNRDTKRAKTNYQLLDSV